MKPFYHNYLSLGRNFIVGLFSNKIAILILAIFIFIPFKSTQAKLSEVTLSVSRENQDLATLGFNFPEYLSYVVFNSLENSKSVIYEDHKKNHRIKFDQIKRMERVLNEHFTDVNEVLVHQKVDFQNFRTIIKTIGFSFIKKRKNEQDILFGYIDAVDIEEILHSHSVDGNDGVGNRKLLLQDVVDDRAFNYSVKNLDGKNIESSAKARKIKNKLYNPQLDYTFDEENSEKLITYEILRSQNLTQNPEIFNSFQEYFQKNLEEFYNAGGDMYYDVAKGDPEFVISKMEIEELLTFDVNQNELTHAPKKLGLFLNRAFLPLFKLTLNKLEEELPGISKEEVIKALLAKEFTYLVVKVNGVPVYEGGKEGAEESLSFAADWLKVNQTNSN